MPASPQASRDLQVAGPLGSLAFSQVRPLSSALGVRAVLWQRGLAALGVSLPFFLIHDVGILFAAPSEQYQINARVEVEALARQSSNRPRELESLWSDYGSLLKDVVECEVARRAGSLRLTDDLIVAVLARLLSPISGRPATAPDYRADLPLDPNLFERIDAQLLALSSVTARSAELATLRALSETRLFLLTLSDSLDADTLRLFGILGADGGAGALSQVDILGAFQSPEASDIVSFSLELLPSVLESKTRRAAGTTAAYGYNGIGTRGSIDSLVLSELAWDDLELARRMADNELLYYAREQSNEEQRRVHILLVDASASMRGDRQTFARGMALATGKKLLLEGEEVVYRFFDSRLYEPARAKQGQLPTAYLLSFRGERGRNPARVFTELRADLDLQIRRDARSPVVHLFTHAALYIPKELVAAVSQIAHLAAVFILPSGGKLELDYLDQLDAHWVVDHATLTRRDARSDAAKNILGQSDGLLRDIQAETESIPPPSRRDGPRSEGPVSRRGPASVRR